MDSKVINKAIHINKYQMQNIDCLMDNIAQSISESSHESEVLFHHRPTLRIQPITTRRGNRKALQF